MPEVIQFTATDDDRQAILRIIEEVKRLTDAGQVQDIAIATVERDDHGEPMIMARYFGQAQYGNLVGAVSALQFDMHFQRYAESD